MGKKKGSSFQKSLPKGVPIKHPHKNPFERSTKKYKLLQTQSKNSANTFKDKRIINKDKNNIDVVRRIAKERSRGNKKSSRFNLNDKEEDLLHGGRKISDMNVDFKVVEEEEGDGRLETELHFGGGGRLNRRQRLEERVLKSKQEKDTKKQMNEKQVTTFESMDEGFSDLAALLNFRSNANDNKESNLLKKLVKSKVDNDNDNSDGEEEEDDWDRKQKGFLVTEDKKVKATDRTKTPDEIAQEEKERLEEMEVKRLKRMNGEFDDDDSLSDVSSIDDDDEEEEEEMSMKVGSEVMVKYHANEQELYPQEEVWHPATILSINTPYYNVKYPDGEIEEKVHVKDIQLPKETQQDEKIKLKQQKALKEARSSMPFTFTSDQIPTTLEYLHEDLIAEYASSPSDVNTILKRVYTSTNIKLHPENKEKYHNFYDVLLRRFILVGDALLEEESEERWEQLDYLLSLLYDISQDCPHNAISVWGRRVRVWSHAFEKQCQDISMTSSPSLSAWPSYGIVLLLRGMGHLFPTSDFRHVVGTPVMLLLGQYISHAPIRSLRDLFMGLKVCGLLVQVNRETRRVVPEVYSFLSSLLWLFYHEWYRYNKEEVSFKPIPSIKASVGYLPKLDHGVLSEVTEKLSLRHFDLEDSLPRGILSSALLLIQSCVEIQKDVHQSNYELFADLYKSLVLLSNVSDQTTNDDTIYSLLLNTILKVSKARTPTVRYPIHQSKKQTLETTTPKELLPRFLDTNLKPKDELQQLKREYKQNQKSLQKQMRKDAKAQEIQRRAMSQTNHDYLKERRLKNYGRLEEDQASMNQQVRMNGAGKGGGMGGVKDLMKRDGIRKRKER